MLPVLLLEVVFVFALPVIVIATVGFIKRVASIYQTQFAEAERAEWSKQKTG